MLINPFRRYVKEYNSAFSYPPFLYKFYIMLANKWRLLTSINQNHWFVLSLLILKFIFTYKHNHLIQFIHYWKVLNSIKEEMVSGFRSEANTKNSRKENFFEYSLIGSRSLCFNKKMFINSTLWFSFHGTIVN